MITPIYTALLAIIFVGLSVRTLLIRRKSKVAIGTGENILLLRAMRVHANFSEYVPLALLLLLMLDLIKANHLLIHLLAILLVAGRLSHAYGVSKIEENYFFRVFGMALTFTCICSASLFIAYIYLTSSQLQHM